MAEYTLRLKLRALSPTGKAAFFGPVNSTFCRPRSNDRSPEFDSSIQMRRERTGGSMRRRCEGVVTRGTSATVAKRAVLDQCTKRPDCRNILDKAKPVATVFGAAGSRWHAPSMMTAASSASRRLLTPQTVTRLF